MQHTRRGFTLLELLAVVVMAGIFAAIVLPTLTRSRSTSRRPRCASNLNQIAKAMYMYADVPANGGYFPTAGTKADPYSDTAPLLTLQLLYGGYIQDPKVFACPSARIPTTQLQALSPAMGQRLPSRGTFLNTRICAYGYDPGHDVDDAITALAADKQGIGSNSDIHGPNAGQNVLIGAGTVEFRDHTKNPLGDGVFDDDIYTRNDKLKRNLDAFIRQ